MPQPVEQVVYKVAVFEVLPGQSPEMAFQANYPILTKEAFNTNFTLWTPDFEYPQPGMQYIWSVRAVDSRGNPMGQNDGWADPFIFTVTESSSMTDSDCSCNSIKQSIERRDCNSCYSIFLNGIAIDFDCNIPYYLADINSYISVSLLSPLIVGLMNGDCKALFSEKKIILPMKTPRFHDIRPKGLMCCFRTM